MRTVHYRGRGVRMRIALDSPEGQAPERGLPGWMSLWLEGTVSKAPSLKKLQPWRWQLCQTGCQSSPSGAFSPLAVPLTGKSAGQWCKPGQRNRQGPGDSLSGQ